MGMKAKLVSSYYSQGGDKVKDKTLNRYFINPVGNDKGKIFRNGQFVDIAEHNKAIFQGRGITAPVVTQ